MKNYRKLKAKNLKKDHRWEYITLEGYFGNKWRILKGENTYILILYGKRKTIRKHFADFLQLLGILQGLFLAQLLDHNLYVKDGNN